MSLRVAAMFLMMLSVLAGGARAGQAVHAGTPQEDGMQQRRTTLRTSLQVQRQDMAAAQARRLTPQDRAELRQQLKQQR